MKTENRLERLEAQHVAAFSLLRRLANTEIIHRALMLALLDQAAVDFRRLEEDYEAYLLRFLEQMPPDQQDHAAIDLFREELFGHRNRSAL